MTYLESILKVLVVGLRPRRRPARGLRGRTGGLLERRGRQRGRRHRARAQPGAEVPRASLLFVFVGWVIVTAVLWITRTTIIHHFGVDLFPFMPKK